MFEESLMFRQLCTELDSIVECAMRDTTQSTLIGTMIIFGGGFYPYYIMSFRIHSVLKHRWVRIVYLGLMELSLLLFVLKYINLRCRGVGRESEGGA